MASAHSLSGLIKWSQREEWRDSFDELLLFHLGGTCAGAGIALEGLPDVIGGERMGVLWGCVFEDFLTSELEDGRNIIDDYLKRRGWNESIPNKRYMAGLRASVLSLYEVSDVTRDEGFSARDLIRGGEPVRISEKSGTHALKQWDRVAMRMVNLGARTVMAGGALPFDQDQSTQLLDALRRTSKKTRRALDTEALRETSFVFTSLWLTDVLQQTLHPTLPKLQNSEGDEIVWTTVTYRLKPETDAQQIRLALASIPSLHIEGDSFWNWIGAESRDGKKRATDAQTFVTTMDDGSVVLGNVEVKGRSLVLQANSRRRAQRGRMLIEPALAGLLGLSVTQSQTMAEMMASGPKTEKTSSGLPPEEERAVLREFLDRYYRNLLDEPVPMLGNKSPRRAAKTAQGRQKLVDWLKLLENSAAKDNHAHYDPSWIWEELGIAELRR